VRWAPACPQRAGLKFFIMAHSDVVGESFQRMMEILGHLLEKFRVLSFELVGFSFEKFLITLSTRLRRERVWGEGG